MTWVIMYYWILCYEKIAQFPIINLPAGCHRSYRIADRPHAKSPFQPPIGNMQRTSV